MRGPVDETEQDIEKNMVISQAEKRSGKRSMRRKVRSSTESGTCNVCSAPCSSCMHRKLDHMGSKDDESSDETGLVTTTSQYSVNEGDVLPSFKSKACESLHHTTCEASNLLSVNSSHDSLSENVESKARIRSPDIADASVESEMLPKLSFGRTVAENQLSPQPQLVLDQRSSANKHGDPNAIEGHDDNISCVSRAVGYSNKNVDRKNLHSSALVSSLGPEGSERALSYHMPGLLETPTNDADTAGSSPKILSSNANYTDYVDHGKSPKCQMEQTNLSSLKGASSNILPCHNLAAHNCADNFQNGKIVLSEGTSKVPSNLCPKVEAMTDKDGGDQLDECFKYSNKVEQDEKSNVSVELPDMRDPPSQSTSGDESDESEVMEHDVKVCDICGDAGREDLLAICSRCSDGAEHTYCMREMLRKVPEGDWLCEECKLVEETENQKQGSDALGKRMNKESTQSSIKRHAETMEVASLPKRLAIETSLGSPKSSSPSKVAVLSRESSFKSLDKGKANISEIARSSSIISRLQTSKGMLLKSNSFNTYNSKPKVKLEEVPQKHKSARESFSHDMEGPARMMDKSMSFKSVTTGRPNSTESKVKMLSSSKFPHVQDMKGLKQVKDRFAFERKNLSKLDRPLASPVTTISSTPKVDQKLTSRAETIMLSSASNNKDTKASQSDGKSGALSRSASFAVRKGADIPATSVRSLSMNGMNGAYVDQKFNQVSPKEEPSSSSSWTAERPSNNASENLQDSSPSLWESSNQGEKTRESSGSRLRTAVTAGSKNVTCQKCKEIGHAAENCTSVCPLPSGADVSSGRTVTEISKGSRLKAAIEAAILKKPGIYRKKKESDQSDGLSSSNTDVSSDIASEDQFLVLNKVKNMISDGRIQEGPANVGACSSGSLKQANVSNVNQLNVDSSGTAFPSKVGGLDSSVPYVGKPCYLSEAANVHMKMSTIPEHEYIWLGGFEVYRCGRLLDVYGGIQAHLSSCASPKVHETVKKFPQKINLDEVPRLSIWPRQFHDNGAKEDNIALYFFAKDLESYEKNYMGLLDNMVKKDLGLKGSIDGVELFIFPSTQLPENSQRWNMLYFLWGLFRGKRSNCSDSLKKLVVPSLNVVPVDKEVPTAVKSENLCLPKCVDKETSVYDSSCDVTSALNNSNKLRMSPRWDPDDKVSRLQENSEQQDCRLDSKSFSKIMTSSAPFSSSMEEVGPMEFRLDPELKSSAEENTTNSGSNRGEEAQVHGHASQVGDRASYLKIFNVGTHDLGAKGRVGKEKIVDRMDSDNVEFKVSRDLNGVNVNMDTDTPSVRDPTIKVPTYWQSSNRKRPYLDLSEPGPQPCSITSQQNTWNNVDSSLADGDSKRLKTGSTEPYERSSLLEGNSVSDSYASQMNHFCSRSSIEEKTCDKPSEERAIPEDLETTGRYFFTVDFHQLKDFGLGSNSRPGKEYLSNGEDRLHDGVPNLELALGAETKSPSKGILPAFARMVEKSDNQNKPPDRVMDKEEDGFPASLSLSLSFPSPDKEQNIKPVSKTEQRLPDGRNVDTSLLLFRGFSDK